ncbi:MAG: type III pantothenate kinase [Clostridia bacterium]|nr:type III pantothenate kinase [Clostridia bacterium]
MLLAIDIGNTNVTLGVFCEDKLTFEARFATRRERTKDEYSFELLNMLSLNAIQPADITGAVISSVVPEITFAVGGAVEIVTGCRPLYVTAKGKTGVTICTDTPDQLGADMLVGSIAAIEKYPLPCLVVDLGTATKLYAIGSERTFLGCTIAAGVGISVKALTSGASQLPAFSIEAPETTICTETMKCMQSGTVFGAACMIDGMIDRFEKELGYPFASIVATGGYSIPIVGHCRRKITTDYDLLLDGWRIYYTKNA